MAKKSKKIKPVPIVDPARRALILRVTKHLVGVTILLGLLTAGYYRTKQYVTREVATPRIAPRVVLKNRPPWMSDALATQITNTVRPWGTFSAFDEQLLIDTASTLAKNPWVKTVKEVRRAYGEHPADTLEIECEFRAPVALVHWMKYYWLVDGESVKLPEQFTEAQLGGVLRESTQMRNIRVIEGVTHPPVESGEIWKGDDLAAGLDMAKLLYGKRFADEIITINVANLAGRLNRDTAQITLRTRYDTEIRWGKPVNSKDFIVEVPASQKLTTLEQIRTQYQRVDAGKPWIDIRYDRITFPVDDASARLDTQH
jgi:hypothetical protein